MNNKWIIVDVEANGPIPYEYSMISIGAVILDKELDKIFYGKLKPVSNKYDEETYKITGTTYQEHLTYDEPIVVMNDFNDWICKYCDKNPVFVSDNPAFDFAWINYYFHHYLGFNPFGYSGRRIGDLYCGIYKNVRKQWKHLRKTKHTHNPVDDVIGNAEVLLQLIDEFKLNINI